MRTRATHTYRPAIMIAGLLLLAAVLMACGPAPAPAPSAAPATSTSPAASTPLPPVTNTPAPTATKPAPGPLTEEALKNATYQGIYTQTITLADGKYAGQPFASGGTSRPTVNFAGIYALGDLNGDGTSDAAVILAENSGGSGTFLFLAAVVNRGGKPENAATTVLGDRWKVESLVIAGGQIQLEALTHGPQDPMCCPSQKKALTYVLQGGQLVKANEVSAPAGATIIGVIWKWERFKDQAGLKDIAVSDPGRYTLKLLPDGTYQLKADCNSAGGKYTLAGSSLRLEPGPTTLAECAPDSLYKQYLSRLGDVVTFVRDGSKLALNLKMDAGDMIFVQGE